MWSRGQSLLPPCNCEYGYLAVHTSRCSQRHAELMETPGPTIVEVPEEPSATTDATTEDDVCEPRCGKCDWTWMGWHLPECRTIPRWPTYLFAAAIGPECEWATGGRNAMPLEHTSW